MAIGKHDFGPPMFKALILCLGCVLGCGMALAQEASEGAFGAAPSSVTPGSSRLGDAQNPFLGGVPSGKASNEVIDLSLQDAIERGLRYNLGLLLSEQATAQARAQRLQSLAKLLPNITAGVAERSEQINLAAVGFSGLPGISQVIGPFSLFDLRAFYSQPVVDLHAFRDWRSSIEKVQAAQFSYQNARDVVVLVVGANYVAAVASSARIDAAQAQVNTAQTLYTRAEDLHEAGVVPAIDVVRAEVELKAQQQRLLVAKNDFEKRKLTLARAIGLPVAQQFRLTDFMRYEPIPPLTLDEAIQRAYQNRPDYRGARARVRAAELSRKSAVAQRYPSIRVGADYGTIGRTPGSSHGTFTATAGLTVPVFDGGRIRADIEEEDAALRQRQAEYADLQARVEEEVRTAFLDLNSAAEQVQVADSSVNLANDQVRQAQDRFSAGVTNNVEVVQAQEALARANDNYINSLFAHTIAKLSLARSLGVAEESVKDYLRRK